MAHNIEVRDGKASIAFAGETPWHRLGQKLPAAFDAASALKHGGLNFTVEKVKIQTCDGLEIPNRFALRRTDTKDALGIVTDFYKPMQNRDAFGFFDGIFGKGKARYEVAGVLGKGEKVWLLAKLNGEFSVGKEDTVGKYLLLTNGHDTNEPIRAKFTPIRVVCQNTLTAALTRTGNEIRIQHIGNVPAKLELAGKLMKQAGIYYDELQATFNGFLKFKIKTNVLRGYALRVLPDKPVKWETASAPIKSHIQSIERNHEAGRGADIKGVRGTLWGAYNAITEFVDHERTKLDAGFIIHGRGAELKERAFSIAQEMAVSAN
jgi:phage/plasmid-like protein (TIGR03299 family)